MSVLCVSTVAWYPGDLLECELPEDRHRGPFSCVLLGVDHRACRREEHSGGPGSQGLLIRCPKTMPQCLEESPGRASGLFLAICCPCPSPPSYRLEMTRFPFEEDVDVYCNFFAPWIRKGKGIVLHAVTGHQHVVNALVLHLSRTVLSHRAPASHMGQFRFKLVKINHYLKKKSFSFAPIASKVPSHHTELAAAFWIMQIHGMMTTAQSSSGRGWSRRSEFKPWLHHSLSM